RTDDVAQTGIGDGADHRSPLGGAACTPADGKARGRLGLGMGRETDMARPVRRRHGLCPEENEPSPKWLEGSKGSRPEEACCTPAMASTDLSRCNQARLACTEPKRSACAETAAPSGYMSAYVRSPLSEATRAATPP